MDSFDSKFFDLVDFNDFNFPGIDEYSKVWFQPEHQQQQPEHHSYETTSELMTDSTYEHFSESNWEVEYKPAQKLAPKLIRPSKKISKPKKEKAITRNNAAKLEPFFENWKNLRKGDRFLRNQVKLWFSSFNMKLNKTYLYREFFDSVRIHFRLAIREGKHIDFDRFQEADWQRLFVNLTSFLMNEVNKSAKLIIQGKKSQVYPVWIEDVNTFKIDSLPCEQSYPCLPDSLFSQPSYLF